MVTRDDRDEADDAELAEAGWLPPSPRKGESRLPSHRLILIEMAIAVLVVFTISGFLYLELWRGAAQDLTRILPEATITWTTTPPPRLAVDRVAALDRWRTPVTSDSGGGRTGFLESAAGAEIFGLPLEQIRQLYRSADTISFAVVPTDQGPTSMVFAEVRDLLARKRVTARLAPFLEPVGRHVGFRIDAAHRSPWLRFAGVDRDALRVVSVDPYLVFSWGPVEGLEELLDARVGGESDPLRTRLGFMSTRGAVGGDNALDAFLDPAAVWSLLATPSDTADEPGPRLIDDLDLVTATARLVPTDEVLDVRALVHDPDDADRLGLSLVNRRHELIELAPSDAPWVVSLITERPLATLSAVRELILRVGRDLGGPGSDLRGLADALSSIEIESIVRLDWEVAAAFSGEVAFMHLPPAPGVDAGGKDAGGDWAIVARLERPRVVEQALERLLPFILGDRWAYGQVMVDGRPLHVVRPADAGEEGAAPAPDALAWRIDGPLLELAPRGELLDRLRLFRQSGRTYGDTGLAQRALAALPDDSAAVVVLRPDALAGPMTPLLDVVASRLAPDFRIAVTLRAELPWLRLSSNFGPWTVAAVVASATRDEVNSFTLPGLDPACREAHIAMCRIYPDAVPCQPLSVGRSAHIQRACEMLLGPRPGAAP